MNDLLGYDLVILQYGLNIMETGVRNYTNYAGQIEKMVAYVRQCFPTAAVLVLGVSDRCVKSDAGFEPMDAIPTCSAQRQAAQNTGAAFWPTYDAMHSLGGMEQFVANGWAGKDFTHINFAGGRRVAWSLYDAINRGAEQHPPFTPVAHDNRHRHPENLAPGNDAAPGSQAPYAKTLTPGHDPDGGKYRGKAGFDAHVRRIAAVDLQQRAVPFPLRRIPLLLRIHPPGSDGPHRLCHPLFALLLLQVERHLLPAARLRFGERLLDRPCHLQSTDATGESGGSWG